MGCYILAAPSLSSCNNALSTKKHMVRKVDVLKIISFLCCWNTMWPHSCIFKNSTMESENVNFHAAYKILDDNIGDILNILKESYFPLQNRKEVWIISPVIK